MQDRRKICAKEKQSHKTIFMWFDNFLTSMELQYSFSLSKSTHKTLTSKIIVFLSCTQDLQQTTKRAKKFFPRALPPDPKEVSTTAWTYQPKHSLHGLSFRKSLIKNHNNIISGRVIIQIKHNEASQSPTQLPSKLRKNAKHQPLSSIHDRTFSAPLHHPMLLKLHEKI